MFAKAAKEFQGSEQRFAGWNNFAEAAKTF